MSETGSTKRRGRVEELRAASESVTRLRRELSEAEARRDELVRELVETAPALRDAVLPPPRPIVVQSRYMAFIERIRPLTGEFSRRRAGSVSEVPNRTVGEYLKKAVKQGILRRTQKGWFKFRTTDEREKPARLS